MSEHPDLGAERVDYAGPELREDVVPAEPYPLFDAWLADAFVAKERGVLPEPTAMVISTVSGGRPSSRTVLLKEADPSGFVFFSNYDSRKGAELAGNGAIALHFGWYPLQKQVRVEGRAVRVSRAESEAYFATRPRGSQLGAWASLQSTVVTRESLLRSYATAEARFPDEVPCPPHWGGYRVTADLVEFWQGQPSRMHDRLRYRRTSSGWRLDRLAP